MSKLAKLRRAVGDHVDESVGAHRPGAPPAGPRLAEAPAPAAPRERPRLDEATFRVPIRSVRPDPGQPRKDIPAQSIEALAASLRARGQLQPILVRKDPGGEGYLIVAGERRWRAAMHAMLPELVCRVAEARSDEAELRADQLAENVMREDLAPMDLARALAELRDKHGWTQARIAEKVGLAQPAVSKALALLDLPKPVQTLVEREELPPSTAREIVAKVEDPKAAVALAKEAAREGLTRDQVQAKIRGEREHSPGMSPPPATDIPGEYSDAAPAPSLGAPADTKPGAAAELSSTCELHGRVKGGRYTLKALGLEAVEIPDQNAIVGDLAAPKGRKASVRFLTTVRGHHYVYNGCSWLKGRRTEAYLVPITPKAKWKGPILDYTSNPSGVDKTLGVEVIHKGEPWVLGSGRDGLIVLMGDAPAAAEAKAEMPRPAPAADIPGEYTVGPAVSGMPGMEPGEAARTIVVGRNAVVLRFGAGEPSDLDEVISLLRRAEGVVVRELDVRARRLAGPEAPRGKDGTKRKERAS